MSQIIGLLVPINVFNLVCLGAVLSVFYIGRDYVHFSTSVLSLPK